jgi:hypothetical protein
MEKSKQFNYITYGANATSEEVIKFLKHMTDRYIDDGETERPTPVCIWGMHGIGKTEIVNDFAKDTGFRFVYIAPAQFEEMGDLVGMPRIESTEKGSATRFVAPNWVPIEEGPGILLIDDVNRADDRILRGIMQLLQNYELVSWQLPQKWIIVLTANPDGGDYSVTTMDDAMITRMMHISLEFNAKVWASWAERKGIDPRGINFVLSYPEIVNGRRTTPRSLVQFFQSIKTITDLKKNLEMVKMLADGCLEKETAIAFINFINMDMDKLVSPEDILGTPEFKMIDGRLKDLVDGQTKRMDILSVIITRLVNFVKFNKKELSNKEFDNVKNFILLPYIPNDLRLSMAQDLVNSGRNDLKRLYAVPEIGKLILTKM